MKEQQSAWGRSLPINKPSKAPNDSERYQAQMDRAVDWVKARGGRKQVAVDTLLISLDDNPRRVRDALEKAGAPIMTFGLIYKTLFSIAKGPKP